MERQENWEPIQGFEGLYDISDFGRVYSYYSNKILNPKRNKGGYLFVALFKNGKQYNKRINRLVAEHFISNPEGYPVVNHKNEIKTDNRIENLEWVNHQFNSEFSQANYYVLYGPNDERLEIYNMRKFARENNLTHQHLYNVATGKRNSHKGYSLSPKIL